jgi:hypothetical protein
MSRYFRAACVSPAAGGRVRTLVGFDRRRSRLHGEAARRARRAAPSESLPLRQLCKTPLVGVLHIRGKGGLRRTDQTPYAGVFCRTPTMAQDIRRLASRSPAPTQDHHGLARSACTPVRKSRWPSLPPGKPTDEAA